MNLELGNDYLPTVLKIRDTIWQSPETYYALSDVFLADDEWQFLDDLAVAFHWLNTYHSLFQTTGVSLHRAEYDLVNLREHLSKEHAKIMDQQNKAAYSKHIGDVYNSLIFHFDMSFRLDPVWREVSMIGSLLHPFYRGRSLLEEKDFKVFLADLVANHVTTKATPYKIAPFKDPMDAYTKEQLDEMDLSLRKFLQHQALKKREEHEKQVKQHQAQVPLQRELDRYFNLPLPELGVNVLSWWKARADYLPILAEFAKEYLAFPFGCEQATCDLAIGRKWSTNASDDFIGSAKKSDLVFFQETTLDLPTIAQTWDFKSIAQVNKPHIRYKYECFMFFVLISVLF